MHQTEQPDNSNSIVEAVKVLMLRNGVSERQQSRKLAEILNLSYSQAHRKLNGGVDWTINQLRIVAENFGEDLSAIGLGGDDAEDSVAYRATVSLGQERTEYPCLVWVGEQLGVNAKVDFVALRDGDVWNVVEAAHCPEKGLRFRVNKLELVVKQPAAPTIAIIDDEQGFADNLCEYLNDSGFQAFAFYNPVSLERAMEERTFDGYIVDWILGERTAEELIRKIRKSTSQDIPVYLLTGEVITGRVDESEAARVIKQFGVQWKEKPIRMATFAAELQKTLGA
ncbi:response regulator [Rugamonas sp. A1-17]|nr:response regulator [Rugamonas sp. A1-17]